MSELQKLKSRRRKYVEAVLHNLPKTLDQTYERILTNIDEIYFDEALSLLRWIVFSKHPLTLAQLSVAASIDASAGVGDEVEFVGDEDFEGPVRILAGLVTVVTQEAKDKEFARLFAAYRALEYQEDEHRETDSNTSAVPNTSIVTDTVRFRPDDELHLAHFSVKEYLASSRILDGPARHFRTEQKACHWSLSQSCIAYTRRWSASKAKTRTQEDLVRFPLLGYAALQWHVHLQLSNSQETECALSILSDERTRQDWLRAAHRYWKGSTIRTASALYYASQFGFEQAVQTLLDAGIDINTKGTTENGLHPLIAASQAGNSKIVQMLHRAGADIAAGNEILDRALCVASQYGHHVVAVALLDAGADVNARKDGQFYEPALHQAILQQDHRMMQMLLDAGADSNLLNGNHDSTLKLASKTGNLRSVQMLLNAGAEVRKLSCEDGSALQSAAFHDNPLLVQTLLDGGADVNAQGGSDGTALHIAAKSGNLATLRVLLDAGADVSCHWGELGTALHVAIDENEVLIAQVLLAWGADVNASGGKFGTALQVASRNGNHAAILTLLEAGADVNAQCGSALREASRYADDVAIRMLLDAGADVNAQEADHGTALQAALCRRASDASSDKVVRMLLNAGSKVHCEGAKGTALHEALARASDETVRLLLEAGANVNADGKHGTALVYASSQGRESIVRLLLDAGADVNAQKELSALQAASAQGFDRIVKMLIDAGVDVNARAKDKYDDGGIESTERYSDALVLATTYSTDDDGAAAYFLYPKYVNEYMSRSTVRNYERTIQLLRESGAILSVHV